MKRKSDDIKNSNESDRAFGTAKKIVLLGDGCIGKSTFFNKLTNLNNDEYRFPKKYQATDNFDFDRVNLKTNVGTTTIDLWDTAGQERFRALASLYYKGADVVILVFSLNNYESFKNI